MIFPTLKGKAFGYVNLNTEAQEWWLSQGSKYNHEDNRLLIPEICQGMVEGIHKKYSIDYSYGGWMEDRSFLWRGSYLEKEQTFCHLGVDLNVPSGTEVATDFDALVVKVDDDYPEEGGWGPRVIVKHPSEPIYMIYAHLDREIGCKAGDTLRKGAVFAKVGKPPYNGNWFPHCHVQTITEEYFNQLERDSEWDGLDGYGLVKDVRLNAARFKYPMGFISLT